VKSNISLITKVEDGQYRICDLSRNPSNKSSNWYTDNAPGDPESTTFQFHDWFVCKTNDTDSFKEYNHRLNTSIHINILSNSEFSLDSMKIYLVEQYISQVNHSIPLCGKPEIPFGTSIHRIIEDGLRYKVSCAEGFNYNESDILCEPNTKWTMAPRCYPQITCPKFENSQNNQTIVRAYKDVYYVNNSDWYAIVGTRVLIECKSDKNSYGKISTLTCQSDGQWIGNCSNNQEGTGILPNKTINFFR